MNSSQGEASGVATRRPLRLACGAAAVIVLVGLLATVPAPPGARAGTPPLGAWTALEKPDPPGGNWTTRHLRGVSFVDARRGWAVGSAKCILNVVNETPDCLDNEDAETGNGVILATSDGGKTWTEQDASAARGTGPDPLSFGFTDVAFLDGSDGYAVGFAGARDYQVVLATTDGGANWSQSYWNRGAFGVNAGLNTISCTDRLRCHTAGRNEMLYTNDGGLNWRSQVMTIGPGPVDFGNEYVNGVSFTDGPDCLSRGFDRGCYGHAVVSNGSILATTDGGATWRQQVSGDEPPTAAGDLPQGWNDVWFHDHLVGWVVGQSGKILATADGGATWVPQASGTAIDLNGVQFTDRKKGWAVGERGTILATGDGGRTWRQQFACRTGGLTELGCVDEGLLDVSFTQDPLTGLATGYAVGRKGTILKLETSVSGTSARLTDVSCTDHLHCHAVGDAEILATSDGGRTWEPQGRGGPGVSFTDALRGHASDKGGTLATTDGGRTWKRPFPGTTSSDTTLVAPTFKALSFTDGPDCATTKEVVDHGFDRGCYGHAVVEQAGFGGETAMLATDDGGASWKAQEVSPTDSADDPLRAVWFTDHLRGHAVSGTSVWRTSDGGDSWSGVRLGEALLRSESLYGVSFTDGPSCPTTGVEAFQAGCYGHVVGTGGLILATTDGGLNWSRQNSGTKENLFDVSFADASVGLAVGNNGTILLTTDGGAKWTAHDTGRDEALLADVILYGVSLTRDPSTGVATGYAVGTSGTIIKVVIPPPAPRIDDITPDEGPTTGGTPVELRGANFTAASVVTFAGKGTVPLSSFADGRITVLSPPSDAPQEVDVLVTTAGGTATAPTRFAYVLPPEGGSGPGPLPDHDVGRTGCAGVPTPGAGQFALPAGHSLVGFPPGTRVPVRRLYGWFDQDASGSYSLGQTVERGRGYWAFTRCPRLVDLAAGEPARLTLPLGAYRASIVGNPSSTGPVVVSGHDFAARWDRTLNAGKGDYAVSGYREPQLLAVGEAIWVFSYVDTVINLTPR